MYEKGMIEFGRVMDQADTYKSADWFYLPHSCGKWVIGDKGKVADLVNDLQEIMRRD